MKRSVILCLFIVFLVAGCTKKADELFEKAPDERISVALQSYQQVLSSASNGWKVYTFPKGLEAAYNQFVGGFSYFMRFTADGRVTMYSDFDSTKAGTPSESSYRLKAAQRPSLYFDTYNYIHLPADPNAAVSNSPTGSNGTGWGSDVEFSFATERIEGDTIRLLGNLNKTEMVMIRASKAEADNFENKQLRESFKKLQSLNLIGYFKKLVFGNESYYLSINAADKTVTFSWLDANGDVQRFSTGYLSTLEGILFSVPFTRNGFTIRGINFLSFDAANNVMNVSLNNMTGVILNAGMPLKRDVDAARRWYQYSVDRDSYWKSPGGFTVNGVPDGLKMKSIPNFYQNIFWAKYDPTYDVFSILTLSNNSLQLYGPVFDTPVTFTTDGRIIFGPSTRSFGNPPGANATVITNYRTLISNSKGFYLVQTGSFSYDMVSQDGSAWISWQW